MLRYRDQAGAALIMLIGVTAALALLSGALVLTIQNQQHATARERTSKQSFYAAEAALDSAVQIAKVDKTMSTTGPWLDETELAAAFDGLFPDEADDVDYAVYDNIANVNYSIQWDQGGPTADYTPDHRVWVEATVTYHGKQTRTRCLVEQTRVPFAEALPKAVTYSDTGIKLLDQSDIYALDEDGDPDTSGPPYQTSITAGGTWLPTTATAWAEIGRFTTNGTTDLAAAGSNTQSLGITANGSVSVAGTLYDSEPPIDSGTVTGGGHSFDNVLLRPGSVGFLSDYFDQAAQASLADESQAALNPVTGLPYANAAGTPVAYTQFSRAGTPDRILSVPGVTFDSATKTYTFAQDIVVTGGDLVLQRGTTNSTFPAGTRFNFKSLYVAGSLTVTGQITLNTKALYVGRNFTITGPTDSAQAVTHSLGSIFVKATPADDTYGGNVTWNGFASVTSRDYLNPTADPLPMWMGRYWSRSGTFNDEYGPTWVPGNSSTSVEFNSTAASTIKCPLLCTTEKNIWSGNITYGTRDEPMVFFYMCDNNGIYPMVFEYKGTGTYYGLMVINESTMTISNGSTARPSIQGAVFAGCPYDPTYTKPPAYAEMSKSDIVLTGNSCIAYDQHVVGKIATSSLKTTTLITQIVAGSWQQLPVN
jgi:hypothetical protein